MKIETKFNAGDTIWIKEFNPEAKVGGWEQFDL